MDNIKLNEELYSEETLEKVSGGVGILNSSPIIDMNLGNQIAHNSGSPVDISSFIIHKA